MDDTTDGGGGVIHIPLPLLLLSSLPLCTLALVSKYQSDFTKLTKPLSIGIVRSFVQLALLGMILHPIFVRGMDWPWLVYSYVLFMMLIATLESTSRPKYTYKHHGLYTFLTFLLTITIACGLVFTFIIRPSPSWNPQYVVPMCGLVLGNSINGVSITMNHLISNVMEGGRREMELNLSFGASGWESMARLVWEAVNIGVTPLLNNLNVVGLVSIPGMMTGQILGGSSVGEAAHYQILILHMNATCRFATIFLNVYIFYRVAFDTTSHVLRTDRIVKAAKDRRIANAVEDGTRAMRQCLCDIWRGNQAADTSERGYQELSTKSRLDHEEPGSSLDGIQILTTSKSMSNETTNGTSGFLLCVSALQISVPTFSKFATTSSASNQQRILCTNLSLCLGKGEIGIVKGPTGVGKSTFLKVIAGLNRLDHGDIELGLLSIAQCLGQHDGRGDNKSMTSWRTAVRYVTQYKIDIPGTPRNFIARVASFRAYAHGGEFETLTEEVMIAQTQLYIKKWGLGGKEVVVGESLDDIHHSYLDKEWKNLSGGESQRIILAIAMASRPMLLLIDEATNGLDMQTEICVEESVAEYAKKHQAAVLWVTHNEDVAKRMLKK